MTTLIRRVRRLARANQTIERHEALAAAHDLLIHDLLDEIRQLKLDHTRGMHGIVLGWLLSMERPEVDLRDEVVAMERSLGDTLAVLEEHVR